MINHKERMVLCLGPKSKDLVKPGNLFQAVMECCANGIGEGFRLTSAALCCTDTQPIIDKALIGKAQAGQKHVEKMESTQVISIMVSSMKSLKQSIPIVK